MITIVALSALGIVSYLGMSQVVGGVGLVSGVMITHGLLYSGGVSAIIPTAQVHLVTYTASGNGWVKALGVTRAVQGMTSIVESATGDVLATAGGLLLPLVVVPVVMAISLVVFLVSFTSQRRGQFFTKPQRIRFTDLRIAPWLVAGLVMSPALSSVVTIFGFAAQGRFALSATAIADISVTYLTTTGVTMIAA